MPVPRAHEADHALSGSQPEGLSEILGLISLARAHEEQRTLDDEIRALKESMPVTEKISCRLQAPPILQDIGIDPSAFQHLGNMTLLLREDVRLIHRPEDEEFLPITPEDIHHPSL